MVLAHARLPNLSLDPKRIAATSVAIALHALALMVLMLPTQTAPPKPELENDMVVVPLIPTVPPPVLPVVRTPAPTQPIAHAAAVQQDTSVDQATSAVDTAITPPPVEIVDQVEEARPPSFSQISAVLAPAPPYPSLALTRGLSGVVTLRVRVDIRGQPIEASIERSSGSKLLDEAARKFVLARWRFRPAAQDGVPIEAYALLPIEFTLAR